MSQQNVEIVRRIYEAVAAGDSEAVLAKYDPGVEFDFSSSPFGSVLVKSVFHGHEGLRGFMRERYEAWERWEDDCQEVIDAGSKVISVVTSRGRGRESGINAEQTHYAVWAIDAGKVISVRWFGTRAEAIEAVGLTE